MKEKKHSANWYIAATHYLTAGFAIPFILSLVIGIPLLMILGKDGLLPEVGNIILVPFIVWLSVMYSSKYVNKTYVIEDRQKVINLATIYLIVIAGSFQTYSSFKNGFDTISMLGFARIMVMTAVFYWASKKYIHNTEAEAKQSGSNMP